MILTRTDTDSAPAVMVRSRRRWPRLTLLGLVLAAWLVFGWALVAQHRALRSRTYDLAYFDQVIWNTSQGRWFETTFVEFNFLGEHVSLILLLFALLYRLGANLELVLILQAGAVAGAAVPLAWTTRRLLGSPTAAVLVALAYLLAAPLHRAVLFDFHPELFGIAVIFIAIALLVADRPTAALVTIGALILFKEDAALVGLGFAWLVWLGGFRRHALLLAGLSLVYGVAVLGVLMPHLRGDAPGLMARYGYLGDGLPNIVEGAVQHPGRVWQQLTSDGPRSGSMRLLVSTALLPLTSPAGLALLPVAVPNLLSTHAPQGSLDGHYGTYPFALGIVATLLSAQRLLYGRRCKTCWDANRLPATRRPIVLAAFLLGFSFVSWYLWSPLGGRFEAANYRVSSHAAVAQRVMTLIPPEAAVSAQSNLLPHLSRRTWVRDFPRLDGVEYVVVDFQSWGMWQTTFDIYATVYESLPSLGFCQIYEEDGLHLYQHMQQDTCPPLLEGARASSAQRPEELRQTWSTLLRLGEVGSSAPVGRPTQHFTSTAGSGAAAGN